MSAGAYVQGGTVAPGDTEQRCTDCRALVGHLHAPGCPNVGCRVLNVTVTFVAGVLTPQQEDEIAARMLDSVCEDGGVEHDCIGGGWVGTHAWTDETS